ncbi:MAG TPA: 16S rRNA (cytosine(1402)-N(4))-methyltransferase [Clostridiales bacterium]|nr:16S rRNA (cytosine(1402)-N(4))-methyltransferase [Clostridiales bacterium]
MEIKHVPVMLEECMENLNLKKGGVYFDATLGAGGHSGEILKRAEDSKLISTDLDTLAVNNALTKFSSYGKRFTAVHDNFKNFSIVADELDIDKFDGILVDLGVSSMQLDMRERGFSYMAVDEKLDMRMNEEQSFSAYDVVNTYSEKALAEVIDKYGEERFSKKIAENIVKSREISPVKTCGELVKIIEQSIPKKFQRDGHPAKRTFQAIRIEVNGELEGLDTVLREMALRLAKGGRLAVITFHSLEDRIVKNVFKDLSTGCTCDKSLPICVCGRKEIVKEVTRKPLVATEKERADNPRSKSAKLRVIEKL